MRVLRTPDQRSTDLPGFPYEPRYVEVAGGDGGTVRLAHVTDGPADGATVLRRLHGPSLAAFPGHDPITGGGDRRSRQVVPGAQGRPHVTPAGGGHFLQEDVRPRPARVLADLVAATP